MRFLKVILVYALLSFFVYFSLMVVEVATGWDLSYEGVFASGLIIMHWFLWGSEKVKEE